MKKTWLQLTSLSMLCYSMTLHATNVVNLQILSATVKDQKIEGASVILQKNGEQSISGSSNAQGQAMLNSSFIDDASTLLIVKKPGYSNLVVKCPCAGMTYAISPIMKSLDGLRVVLNWGAQPADLDSHIVYPNNHVFFSHMQGTDALLDVDDTTSYGPETITVERKHDGERYVYAVHNYTDRDNPNSSSLAASQAKVFVYIGQTLVRTYYVPKNQKGNLWTVFALTEGGEFQSFNTIKSVTSHERLQTSEFQGVIDHSTVENVAYSTENQEQAKKLNQQGEKTYHDGKYDEAIALYQAAIELNGNYGQAYSNLGLAFQKQGNVAEALWANRKAIALASGDTAATVRASSHYNNGKIYEDAAQWNDALREYQAAKQEKNKSAYDQAIKRMLKKGAK